MANTVVITLFRHGLTEGNKRKAYMGWNDSPLCEEAVTKLSSYQLKPESYDLFLSSDLNRCLHTMKLLFPTVEPETAEAFREMHFGTFQGKTYDELQHEESYQKWLEDPIAYAPPDGETYEQFASRIDKGWEKIQKDVLEEGIRRPIIVTHGGVIKYLLSQYAPEKKEFWDWKVVHGNGYELVFDLEQLRRGEPCISLREVPITENANG